MGVHELEGSPPPVSHHGLEGRVVLVEPGQAFSVVHSEDEVLVAGVGHVRGIVRV